MQNLFGNKGKLGGAGTASGGKPPPTISFHERYVYHILFTSAKHETLNYRVLRDAKEDLQELIKFFVSEINNDVKAKLSEDIEHDGYWPDNDEHFNTNFFEVKSRNKQVFMRRFMDLEETLHVFMNTMVYLD